MCQTSIVILHLKRKCSTETNKIVDFCSPLVVIHHFLIHHDSVEAAGRVSQPSRRPTSAYLQARLLPQRGFINLSSRFPNEDPQFCDWGANILLDSFIQTLRFDRNYKHRSLVKLGRYTYSRFQQSSLNRSCCR